MSASVVAMNEAKKLHVSIQAELWGHSYPRAWVLELLYVDVVDLVGEEDGDGLTWFVFRGSGLLESLVEMAGM